MFDEEVDSRFESLRPSPDLGERMIAIRKDQQIDLDIVSFQAVIPGYALTSRHTDVIRPQHYLGGRYADCVTFRKQFECMIAGATLLQFSVLFIHQVGWGFVEVVSNTELL